MSRVRAKSCSNQEVNKKPSKTESCRSLSLSRKVIIGNFDASSPYFVPRICIVSRYLITPPANPSFQKLGSRSKNGSFLMQSVFSTLSTICKNFDFHVLFLLCAQKEVAISEELGTLRHIMIALSFLWNNIICFAFFTSAKRNLNS